MAAKESDADVAGGLASADKSRSRRSRERNSVGVGEQPSVADTHVGQALRSAYDQALSEDVPDDFLDLLGKLS